MLTFIGEFLYLIAYSLALIWIGTAIYFVYTTPGAEWDTARVLATIIPAFVLFFIGRIIKYIVAGR
jgi:hypothetical protein